jgi:glutamyl-tRNA reductase
MSLLTVGLSHRTAPVRVLEQAAVPAERTGKLLDDLLNRPDVVEVLLLSTCNRIEVYAVVETFHGGLAGITSALAEYAGAEVSSLAEHLYVHYSAAAVEHLFTVAAGLDSMVLGESQIIGQLRAAYAAADAAGTVGRTLHELTQTALRVGKRVHSETGIDRAGASVVTEALSDAERVLGELGGRRALLVGAGSMGALAASHLRRTGVGEVVVANRTVAKAARLVESVTAEGIAARAIALDQVAVELAAADLLICATGAVGAVVEADAVRLARQHRPQTPLVVCDLGLPKDVDPEVAGLPNVTVIDLESLQRRLSRAETGTDTHRAAEVVVEEVRNYLSAQRSAEVTPTVTALRKRAAEVVDTELLRLDSRLPELDPVVRGEVTKTVRRVVDKLLHTPTVRVKELASSPGGSGYADALRELFALDSQAPTLLSAPHAVSDRGVDLGDER